MPARVGSAATAIEADSNEMTAANRAIRLFTAALLEITRAMVSIVHHRHDALQQNVAAGERFAILGSLADNRH
jgi:hypothetical protein